MGQYALYETVNLNSQKELPGRKQRVESITALKEIRTRLVLKVI
jgi:hypothetical protein